jgi:hypothetical protein
VESPLLRRVPIQVSIENKQGEPFLIRYRVNMFLFEKVNTEKSVFAQTENFNREFSYGRSVKNRKCSLILAENM